MRSRSSPLRQTKLVVFDLDGTLIDSSRDLAAAVNAALAVVAPGTRPLAIERVRTFIGDGARTLVARSLTEAALPLSVNDVLPVFLERYGRVLLDTTRLYPGVREGLDALSDRMLAVLTNKPGDMSRRILEGLGVAHRFKTIYGGGDVAAKKPDPAGLLRLLEESGVTRNEAALVGDSAVDVMTGRAAGVATIGVTYGLDPASLLATPPDQLIDDLRELSSRLL